MIHFSWEGDRNHRRCQDILREMRPVKRSDSSTELLRERLERNYPLSVTCWSQATDEVRDLSRHAREAAGVPIEQAVNFRSLESPAEWNSVAISSIITFFSMLSFSEQQKFLADYDHLIGPA